MSEKLPTDHRRPAELRRRPPRTGIMQRVNIGITSLFALIAIAGWAQVAHYIYVLGWYTPPTVHLIVPCTFSILAAIGWLILTRGQDYGDHETRCRKCRYVLRGISQPRCPECGEAI